VHQYISMTRVLTRSEVIPRSSRNRIVSLELLVLRFQRTKIRAGYQRDLEDSEGVKIFSTELKYGDREEVLHEGRWIRYRSPLNRLLRQQSCKVLTDSLTRDSLYPSIGLISCAWIWEAIWFRSLAAP
jgi:hypothetical protein